jgi:endoglycosylceramidase
MQRLEIGGMLTEFNIMWKNWDPTFPVLSTLEQMIETMDMADTHLISWIAWEYKLMYPITGGGWSIFGPDGTQNDEIVRAVSRSYPQAVAGHTLAYSFNTTTSDFLLSFNTTDITTSEQTLIYINEAIHYTSGYEVSVVQGDAAWFEINSSETNYVTIDGKAETPIGEVVQIAIRTA